MTAAIVLTSIIVDIPLVFKEAFVTQILPTSKASPLMTSDIVEAKADISSVIESFLENGADPVTKAYTLKPNPDNPNNPDNLVTLVTLITLIAIITLITQRLCWERLLTKCYGPLSCARYVLP